VSRIRPTPSCGVRLCVSMLEAPEGAFTQTDRFTAEPQGQYPAQWHARYASAAKSREARFEALLEEGCGGAQATLRRDRISKDGARTTGYPVIADQAWIGPHAIIVGPVLIGEGSRIAGGHSSISTSNLSAWSSAIPAAS